MDSRTDKTAAKRSRVDETDDANPDKRTITLNLNKYPEWVRDQTEEQLVNIFELGLKIQQCATMSLDVNSKIVEEALDSKMKPVHDSVAKIQEEVNKQIKRVQESVTSEVNNQMTKFSNNMDGLKRDVNEQMTTISQKVPPLESLNNSIHNSSESIKKQLHQEVEASASRLNQTLGECRESLNSISNRLDKPSSKRKGDRAEKEVIEILRDSLGPQNFTFSNTTREPGKGDIEAQTPNGHSIMIEVKEWQNALSKEVIEKFEANLANSPNFKVGILLSMTSGIARRSREGRFEIAFEQTQKQYRIYVPNAYANKEEHLILWSVVMAAQLGKLDGEVGDKKTAELKKIYDKFAANIQHSKDCKSHLNSLKASVELLENSIQPILTTVDETTKTIYKLLNS